MNTKDMYNMETKHTNIVIRPLIGTLLLLIIPFLLIQLKIPVYDPGSGYEQLAWTGFDFVVMGIMLFCTGIALEFAMRKLGKYRVLAMIAIVLAFLFIWAQLAVGIFETPFAGS